MRLALCGLSVLLTACPKTRPPPTPPPATPPPATPDEAAPARPDVTAQTLPTAKKITWDPIVKGGDHLYFVGNSYTGNTGGLPNHMQRAWLAATTPIHFEHASNYYWGKRLGSMDTPEVTTAIEDGHFDTCVITSGTVAEMQQFTPLVTDNCGHFVVFMTWAVNPTIGSMKKYRAGTASIVADMREFETQTDARIVPSGLVYWDLIDNPPREGLRQDWVYWPGNIHQNGVGIAVNTYVFYAALVGESPVGIDYEFVAPSKGAVIVSGDQVATEKTPEGGFLYDEVVFDEALRNELQQRAYDLTEAWVAGRTEFD